MPSVSVIIPVYNVERDIARCARSLFGQTLQDMEFVFVDDCTPDRSMEIIHRVLSDEFPYRIPQTSFYRMPRNSGLAVVRYFGYTVATGDYVIACDSDDDVSRDIYREMYERAVMGSFDMVICDFFQVKDGKRSIHHQFSELGKQVDDVLVGRVMGSLWSRMFRRSLLEGVKPAVASMTEDVVITIQILCKSHSIGYIQEPLYFYYLRGTSISLSSGKDADIARWRGFYANSRLLVDIMTSGYGFENRYPPLVYYKYRTRYHLQKYVHIPECYKMWRSTFPEIDRYFLFTPGIPLREKFWFILIHLHLYHPWKVMTGKA